MSTDGETRRNIYVVADDESLIRALAEHRKPGAGWRFARPAGPPEPDALVILDLEDETERRRMNLKLRSDGYAGPLLILGDAGAAASPDDEPVGRPVRLGVLLARIDAHASDPEGEGSHRLGPYEFDPADRELRHRSEGGAIRLTELECKLLGCLVESRGAVVGRDQLLARVWGYSAGVTTHTVETHVWRLRQKIETDDPTSRFLMTEPGGYRLVVAVSDRSS